MKLNEDVVKSLPVPAKGNKVHYFPGAILQGEETPRGFGVRVTAAGVRSFVINYRSDHVEKRYTIGRYPDWSVLAAVKKARELRQEIDGGTDPLADRRKAVAASKDTFENIANEFFKREGAQLRSKEPRERVLKRLVYPVLGGRDITSIKRTDIIRLLDDINDANGRITAHRVKAYMSRVFNWHAGRSDEFRSPIVKGMPYSTADEEERERVLSDDELRRVWKAAVGPFGTLVKFILLTAARRSEAARMSREELTDGVWLLPAARNKTKLDLARPLTTQALAVLPEIGPYFFSTTGGAKPIVGFAWYLTVLQTASGTSDWTLHDLRRTARTLMSRAKVLPDDAERCLGHVIGGVRKIYDRYEYFEEKKLAYKALAALIERIVDPPADNVMPLKWQAI